MQLFLKISDFYLYTVSLFIKIIQCLFKFLTVIPSFR